MIYEGQNQVERTSFSFLIVLQYPEVIRLIIISTLMQLSTYISLDADNVYQDNISPEDLPDWPLFYYFCGASVGLFVTALYSGFLNQKYMFFLPILVTMTAQFLFYFILLVYCTWIAAIPNPNQIIIFLEGFF